MEKGFSGARGIGGRFVLISVALALIGGYTAFEARRYIEGPVITLIDPLPGATIEDRLITLKADTRNIAAVKVNGRDTYVTEAGLLQEHILLAPGYTVVAISAVDRFGHKAEKRIEFYTP